MQDTIAFEISEFQIAGQGKTAMAGEPATRLQRNLRQDGEGHGPIPVVLEIPGIRWDIVFGADLCANFLHARPCGHVDDPRHHVIWLLRQTGYNAFGIEPVIHFAKGRRWRTVGAI